MNNGNNANLKNYRCLFLYSFIIKIAIVIHTFFSLKMLYLNKNVFL